MKKSLLSSALVAAMVSVSFFAVSAPASAKPCEYENGAQCSGWYPNANTCRDIYRTNAAQWKKASCMAWAGFGSRG